MRTVIATESKEKYRGVFVAAPTPMRADYSLNLGQIKPCIDYIVKGGMKAGLAVYAVLGAGGEHMHLSVEERKAVAEAAVEASAGRVPIFVGVTHNATQTTIELARHAEQIGADGLQLEPPFYFGGTADDVFEYFRAVSESVALGITAYNTPWTSGFDMDRKFITRLASLENIIGLKWYSGSPYEFAHVLHDFNQRFNIISNYYGALGASAFVLGARGFVSQPANFAPAACLKTLAAFCCGDYARATELYLQVDGEYSQALVELIRSGYNGEGNFIKACMPLVGLDCGPARPPHRQPPGWFVSRMRAALEAAGELSG